MFQEVIYTKEKVIEISIKKVIIENFKCFGDRFTFELNEGLNIIVGDNGSGKSTILEAIHLALTGQYAGRNIQTELSQYLFNKGKVDEYVEAIQTGTKIEAPSILIELFFNNSINPEFEGNNNSLSEGTEGVRFEILFNEIYTDEYQKFVESKKTNSLPIEYYEIRWTTFARDSITYRSIPIKSAMIDSSNYRFQNGSDVYISRIVKNLLSEDDVVAIAQAHRSMKDKFGEDLSIQTINEKICDESSLVDGTLTLSVDLGSKNAWENSLVTQLDEIPFSAIGKGAQCTVKTELALGQKDVRKAGVVLLEEPECHLSFSKLSNFISTIETKCANKQIILSTHSSFVANKLGLDNLILLKNQQVVRFSDLNSSDFFRKMPGYDTLRLVLAEKVILVEGDADELVVQKAYMAEFDGRLPIQDGIDVISVGTSFLRFLEIANILQIRTAVITDSDGNLDGLAKKYKEFDSSNNISIYYDKNIVTGDLLIGKKAYNYNTLEPILLRTNSLEVLNKIFNKNYSTNEKMQKFMYNNKADCALAIFETSEQLVFPDYIKKAIQYVK